MEVPDLRAFRVRLAFGVVALVLGLASAMAIALLFPQEGGREASAFAPAFLVLAMAAALAVGWYALFDALRRWTWRSDVEPLPVARVRRMRRPASR